MTGWQREILLMNEYGIWNATAFACAMNTLIGIKTRKYEAGKPIAYIFASCQYAEHAVYPFLMVENLEKCGEYVDEFYNDASI